MKPVKHRNKFIRAFLQLFFRVVEQIVSCFKTQLQDFFKYLVLSTKSKKTIFKAYLAFILLIVGLNNYCRTQTLSNYAFAASSGTYTALSGSTFPTLSSADDGYVNSISIGFDFWYMGTKYTTIGISTNGFVSFGTLSSTYASNALATGGVRPLLAPLWDDLDAVTTGSNISYKLSGTAPNRTFTVEFNDMQWNYQATAAVIDFQIILTETTGKIEFVYFRDAQAYNAGSTGGGSIGITATATGSNNYMSLDGTGASPGTSLSTETTNLATKPADNQIYTFTPLTTSAPTSLTFSGVGLTGMTLDWTNQGSNRVVSAIYNSTDNVTFTYVGTATSGATSYAATGLSQSTTYYWKVYSVSEGYVSSALSGSQATTSDLNTWDGSTNTDWNTAANWSTNAVPTATSEITIPDVANDPSITGTEAAVCLNLTIDAGAVLTVSSSVDALKIGGNLINNGTITHTGSSSATSASSNYWIQMTGAGKTMGGTGDFSTVGFLLYTSGSSTTLTSNVSLSKIFLSNIGTDQILNLSSYTLAVSTMFYQVGVINLNTGTLEYSGTASESSSTWTSTNSNFGEGTGTVYLNNSGSWTFYPALGYYNLKIKTNSGQEHDGPGSETITNNFELVAGTSGGKLHHHSTTLVVGGNVTIGAGSELNLAGGSTCKNITVTGNIDVSGTITCYSTGTITTSGNLTINNGGTITSSTSSIISVAGNWVNDGTFTKSTGSVKFTGAANKTISGSTTTSFYNITVDKSTDTTYCIEATGAMGMTGHLTLTNGVMKLTHASSSAQFTANTTIASTAGLWINGGSFSTNYYVICDGLFRATSGTATIGNDAADYFQIENSTSLFQLNGGNVTVAENFNGYNGPVIKISSGTLTSNTQGHNHATIACINFQGSNNVYWSGGTIIIQTPNAGAGGDYKLTAGAGTKTINGGTLQIGNASTAASKIFLIESPSDVYNLTVNSTNAPTARLKTNALTVSNTVTVSGGILDANTNSLDLTVGGNWINNSSTTSNSKIGFDSGSKKVTFNGGAAQTISGSAVTTFYDLDIANTSGNVTLAVNSSVNNALTLTSNKFIVQGYTLTVGTGSANGSITGGSSSCYIVAYDNAGTIGYLKRFINSNATYSYPLGDASSYTPLTFVLSASSLASAYLTVYTKATKVTGLNEDITNYINRYWDVTQSGITSPTYDISYTYVDGDIVGSETDMLPVKKSGSTWYKPTGSSFTNGTAEGTGSLTAGSNLLSWTGLSTFSLFGGAVNSAVALPIELVSFTGKKEGKNNELKWTTASELNNDFFTVEKTLDGNNFETIGTVKGAGNSNQFLNYSMIDYDVRNVLNYYRLKQTDFDGKYDFSEIITIDNSINKPSKEIALITNILGQEVNEYYRGIVIIVYSDGTSIKVIQ